MEYIIIGILILLVVLVTISLFKNINEGNITERLGKLENNVTRDLYDFKNDINKNLNEEINALNDKIELRLNMINDLSNDIVSLQGILTDKKSRGIYGEVNLKHILTSVFGEKNDKIYRLQYTLPNSTIVDAALFAPEPLGLVGIDSKFPLEHYRIMVDKRYSASDRETAAKLFKSDVKKHIDAIASKYIIEGVTSDQAKAIFAELNAYHNDIIEYAYKKRVWITSPTTLMSTLTTIQVIIKNAERDKYAKVIREELVKLSVEFSRYKDRWDKLSRSIQTVSKDVEDIHTTTDKITKRFNSINSVELDENLKIE